MKRIIHIICIALLIISCKKNSSEIDLGYSYVPLDSGLTLVYQVRDIFHDEALVPAHDTNYYQIKTVLQDLIVDDTGDESRKMKRFIRTTDTNAWEVKDIWTIKNTASRTEIVEENQRIIDFVFAPGLSKTWNANALNNLEPKNSVFTSVHQPFQINGFSFDSTCITSHQDFTSFIDFNSEYDVFAKNIGKIYSVVKELRIDNFDTLDIKKGFELEYQLIEYSK